MSLLSNLMIGRSGLSAAQAGLNATAQNVANSAVDGATRRTVATSVASPIQEGRHWIGQGAAVEGIERPSNRFLESRRIESLGSARRSELAWGDLQAVERVFDASQGVTTKDNLEAFFDSLTRVTSDPSDLSLRRGVVRAAQDLASYLARDARSMDGAMKDEAADLIGTLPLINERLAGVAELNRQIASSGGGTLSAGDLMDRRAVLLEDLGQLAGVQVEVTADGVANVYIDGHAAVSGQNARSLSGTTNATTGRPQVLLSHSDDEGIDVTDGLGGEAAGRLDVWDTVSDLMADLNTFATDLSAALNTQHRAGFDLNGDAGEDLFTFDAGNPALTMTVNATIIDDAATLAFGESSPTLAGDIGNLRALLDLENDTIIAGSSTASGWLTSLTSELGTTVSRLEQQAQSQSLLARDLTELHQNLHGIDLDEEATNLLLYQTAYQAAARVVAANDELMNSLLELV